MMIAPVYVERSRELLSDEKAHREHERLSRAERRSLVVYAILAPVTGLAGPLLLVPALGNLGWVLTGLGLLACVTLMFWLGRLDADKHAYEPLPPKQLARVNKLAHQYPHVEAIVKNARRIGRKLYEYDFGWISLIPLSWKPVMMQQSFPPARVRKASRSVMPQSAMRVARHRPYHLAH